MQLYGSPTSPFVRKVRVLLHETGQQRDVAFVLASGTPLDPGTTPTALNPLGKVPCLERPDGPAIYDSRVICRYLDARAGGRLYPPEPRLWEALTLEAMADGMMEAMVAITYETRLRPEEHRLSPIVEGLWLKIVRALDILEDRWIGYLAGPLDAAQIAIGCALGYLDLRAADRHWREGRPALAAWFDGFDECASMQETRPPALTVS